MRLTHKETEMEMYLSAEEFAVLYPNAEAGTYSAYSWDAQKYLDNATSGVDGVKKLQYAFPTDEDDAEAVKRCEGAIIMALDEVAKARAALAQAGGYTSTSAGLISNSVRSVSAGGESITYGADASAETEIRAAAKSNSELKSYVYGIVRHYLEGVADDNGVNLLYGGRYPNV